MALQTALSSALAVAWGVGRLADGAV
jgi:hypothetical protein